MEKKPKTLLTEEYTITKVKAKVQITLKPGYHTGLYKHKCVWCNEIFYNYFAKSKYHHISCYAQSMKTGIKMKCKQCYKKISVKKYFVRNKIGNFCSPECWHIFLQNTREKCEKCGHIISKNLEYFHSAIGGFCERFIAKVNNFTEKINNETYPPSNYKRRSEVEERYSFGDIPTFVPDD